MGAHAAEVIDDTPEFQVIVGGQVQRTLHAVPLTPVPAPSLRERAAAFLRQMWRDARGVEFQATKGERAASAAIGIAFGIVALLVAAF